MRNPQNDTGETLTLEKEAHVPERTCVLTRRKAAKEELIRLALSPEGDVAPDVRARAPGRGAWIGVTRSELDAANAKGKLKGALQRAFKTNDLSVPDNLGERTEHALRQTALDRLGMEARAGNLINGADKVEAAARRGQGASPGPRAGRERGRTSADGSGLARRRWRSSRGDIPRRPYYLVHGTGARKCGTCRPDRSRRRFACPTCACPVASFHWPRSWSGRWRTRLEDRLG